tara:strand:+ start:141 stop:404 length:264 start_codon:yes stop_codon:yes gene_type:complete
MVSLISVLLVILFCLNLISALRVGEIFLPGYRLKTNKNMSVFELKQECNKQFSLGTWCKEGESGFLTGVVFSVTAIFVLMYILNKSI